MIRTSSIRGAALNRAPLSLRPVLLALARAGKQAQGRHARAVTPCVACCVQIAIPPSCPLDASPSNVSAPNLQAHVPPIHPTSLIRCMVPIFLVPCLLLGQPGTAMARSLCPAALVPGHAAEQGVILLYQGEPVGYLHAGMVQHDPQGSPAFLHRTAEGKVYPFNHGYRRVGLP